MVLNLPMNKLNSSLILWFEYLKRSAVFPYLGVLIVLASTFYIYPSGDTQALLNGLDHALTCLSSTPVMIPCGVEVVHFPIFQYLVGAPFSVLGFKNATIVNIFGLMSVAWTLIAGAVFWRTGVLTSGKPGGHLSLLVLLSGYLLWYMTASFNEAASFGLFALLALSVIDRWRIIYVCIIAFACTITKEVAFPFVLYFMSLSFFAREMRMGQALTVLGCIRRFLFEYKFAICSVIVGVVINLLFNYFRFGSVKNLTILDVILLTPWEYVPGFFVDLFMSPAGGLVFTWFSLCMVLIIPTLFLVRDRTTIWTICFVLIGLMIANFGLARWYSPFGWYAWGPRLTLPFLGSVGVIGLYLVMPYVIKYLQGARGGVGIYLVFIVVAASSLPNIAVRINEGAFFSRMFAPTKIAIESGIPNFTVQTVPPRLYMEAASEAHSRNVVIPTAVGISLRSWLIISLWLCSLFYISRQLVSRRKEEGGKSGDVSSSNAMYLITVAKNSYRRVADLGLTRQIAIALGTLLLLAIGPLIGRISSITSGTPVVYTEVKYQLIPPQSELVGGLENFPATLPLAEIQIELNESENLDAVYVLAPDGLGEWTTHPINNLWGVGIIDKEGGYKIRNEGSRNEKLNLPISRKLTLWIADNGNLSKCTDLNVQLLFAGGKIVNTLAGCKNSGKLNTKAGHL